MALGIIMILLGLSGLMGLTGPLPSDSVFGDGWWLSNVEVWVHLVVGIVLLVLSYAISGSAQRSLAMIVGVVALLVGIYSIFKPGDLAGFNLERPADTVLFLVIGLWGWMSSRGSSSSQAAAGM